MEAIDFALLLDGLEAEREQKITIDVGYRYFTTAKRSFIIADTPGHEQFTRNMATGASNSELAVILVDARKGVVVQTRRHATICSLLGVAHVVLAVNKIDLLEFDQGVFEDIVADFVEVCIRAVVQVVHRNPDVGAVWRQRRDRKLGDALVSRPHPVAGAGDDRDRSGCVLTAVSLSGAVGQSAEFGFPRLLRNGRERPGAARRPGRGGGQRQLRARFRTSSPSTAIWTAPRLATR